MWTRVSVAFPSEEIVPRRNRARWLERWGPAPETITVCGSGRVADLERAGCLISATGTVQDLSDAVRDQMRFEARNFATERGMNDGGKVSIPDDTMALLLKRAADWITEERALSERRKVAISESYKDVQRWAETCPLKEIREALQAGYDVRTSVQGALAEELIARIGRDPIFRTYRGADIEPRNSPNLTALRVHAEISDAVRSWDCPQFLDVEVGRISRICVDQKLMTVVPVVLSIIGVQPLRLAWLAE